MLSASHLPVSTLCSSLAQVTVNGQSAEGMGPSKKVAKRNAAEKMLELLGYKVPQPQPPKPALKTEEKVLACVFFFFFYLAVSYKSFTRVLLFYLDSSKKAW